VVGVKPARFAYFAPTTVAEAVDALASDEDARVLAGGQSLVPMMNLRLARPAVIVDINGIEELDYIRHDNSSVSIGAICRHRRLELDEAVTAALPLVAEAIPHVAHPHVRNRGTIGGSLAHADPTAELPLVASVLGGDVTVVGPNGARVIAVADLLLGTFTTSIAEGELLTEVRLPAARAGDGFAFAEFAPKHGDFAIVSVAVAITRDERGACTRISGGAAGLGSTPVDLSDDLRDLSGATALSDELLQALAAQIGDSVDPVADVHASAAYRRELTQVLAVQAISTAWDRAA
jgi:carbon-monoxide dehydrogenase medium subunit